MLGFPIVVAFAVWSAWGWVRWTRTIRDRTVPSLFSLVGFAFGTASVVLCVVSLIYGRAIGGFPYWDHRLLRIYRWGALLSLVGLVFSLGGIWRKNSFRWHAPALSFGMLALWFVFAMGE